MFTEFWNAFCRDRILKENITFPEQYDDEADNGYIIPYYDSPMRNDHTSNILFSDILAQATDYVWFYTPYLMLGDSLFEALIRPDRQYLKDCRTVNVENTSHQVAQLL